MRHALKPRVASIAAPIVCLLAQSGGAQATYQVVPEKSLVRIEVGKGGLFGFAAGHTHEVEGPIRGSVSADPSDPARGSIHLTIETARLRVTGKGEPPGDVPKVQERMQGSEVLDVARYREIIFRSRSIAVVARREPELELRVTGDLTLRGETRPVTVPVHVRLDPRAMVATGTLSVKQTDFGIKPISIAGVVSVKDTLVVHFTITATS